MYVHLGSDTVVRDCDIIGIFDIENPSVGKITKESLSEKIRLLCFLRYAQELCGLHKGRQGKDLYFSHIPLHAYKKMQIIMFRA